MFIIGLIKISFHPTCPKHSVLYLELGLELTNVLIFYVKYGNNKIEHKAVSKYLGMDIDSNLSFHSHVEYLKSKTIGKLKLSVKIRPVVDQATASQLYQSLVVPIFDYRDVIYNCISQNVFVELKRL